MTVVIGFLIFVAGAVAGYFTHYFVMKNSQDQIKLAEQISQSEQALAQYKVDVAEHLDNSAKLLAQMNSTCQIAMEQIEQSTQLLKQTAPAKELAMPFFSLETQQQLAATANQRHVKRRDDDAELISNPPLDYSSNPSGLFIDKKQNVTNAE